MSISLCLMETTILNKTKNQISVDTTPKKHTHTYIYIYKHFHIYHIKYPFWHILSFFYYYNLVNLRLNGFRSWITSKHRCFLVHHLNINIWNHCYNTQLASICWSGSESRMGVLYTYTHTHAIFHLYSWVVFSFPFFRKDLFSCIFELILRRTKIYAAHRTWAYIYSTRIQIHTPYSNLYTSRNYYFKMALPVCFRSDSLVCAT